MMTIILRTNDKQFKLLLIKMQAQVLKELIQFCEAKQLGGIA